MKHHVVVASLVVLAVGSAAAGFVSDKSSVWAATSATPVVQATSAVHATPQQAGQSPQGPPAADAPLSRDEIIKQGPAALEQNCNKCHGSDKWEGTNRDHDGWAAIVSEMSRQMSEAQMPPMSDKTTKLIVDYLTLAHPQ